MAPKSPFESAREIVLLIALSSSESSGELVQMCRLQNSDDFVISQNRMCKTFFVILKNRICDIKNIVHDVNK